MNVTLRFNVVHVLKIFSVALVWMVIGGLIATGNWFAFAFLPSATTASAALAIDLRATAKP